MTGYESKIEKSTKQIEYILSKLEIYERFNSRADRINQYQMFDTLADSSRSNTTPTYH